MNVESQIDRLGPGIYRISRPKGPVRHHGLLCMDVLLPGPVVVDLHPSGLRRTTIAEFAGGKRVRVERTRPFDAVAALRRLRQVLAQGARYNLIGRNCEHFVEFILYGVPRSRQVQGVVTSAVCGVLLLLTLRR